MKKILSGVIALSALCMMDANAVNADAFIGTWKMARSTGPNYFIIKKEGNDLVAIRYIKNDLTTKVSQRRYAVENQPDELRIASDLGKIDAHLVNGTAALSVGGDAYEKISPATGAPI
jgi:hypothetical protein